MNENVQVRLEIAKAAISARIKKADAQEWLDWVLVGNTVTDVIRPSLPSTPRILSSA